MIFTRQYKLLQAAEKDSSGGGTTLPKKVTINGKEILFSDLQQTALADAHRWALYLNLSPDQEKAFNEALSTVLEGIGNGNKYENGRYYGNHGNKEDYYGKFSGKHKNDSRAWNGIKRNGYDAFGNVVAYLNGKTNSIKSSSTVKTDTSTVSKKKWSNNSIGSHVYRNLFELMPESEINMTEWANNANDKFDETTGLRNTSGRRKLLIDALNDLNLDNYDLSDEDKTRYNNLLTLAKSEDANLSELALKKLGLGRFLFTTNDYLGSAITDEEKKAKELKAKLEENKKNYLAWMNNSYADDISRELLYDEDLTLDNIDIIGELIGRKSINFDLFYNGLYNDVINGYQVNSKAQNSFNSPYDNSGIFGTNYDMVLHEGIFGADFLNEFNPNKNTWDWGTPNTSPTLYRQKSYNNILSYLVQHDAAGNGLTDLGNGLYAIDISRNMDKDGNFLVYDTSNPRAPRVYRTNIRKYKGNNNLGEDFWNKIYDRYASLYGINNPVSNESVYGFHKLGGILKYQLGAAVIEQYNSKQLEQLTNLAPADIKKQEQENRKLSKGLTGTDYLRLGALAADLTSAVSAWAPGVGTGVSLATGLTGTGANLVADIKEGNKDALKNLGVGLAMDVVGLVPGLGSAGKIGKIAKNLAKWAPRLITMATAANMAPEFINTLLKSMDSKAKLTAKDLKILSLGVAALAGVSRIGAASYNKKLIDNQARTGNYTAQVKGKDGSVKNITLNAELAAALKGATNKSGADAVIKLIDNEATSLFTDKKEFGWKSPSSWFSRNQNNSNVLEQFDYSKVVENPLSWRWVNNLSNFYSHFGLNPNKTNMLRYLDARNFSLGKYEPKSNRFTTAVELKGVPLASATNNLFKLPTGNIIQAPLIASEGLRYTGRFKLDLNSKVTLDILKQPKVQLWLAQRTKQIETELNKKGIRAKDPKQQKRKMAARTYLNKQKAQRLALKELEYQYGNLFFFKEGGLLIPKYFLGSFLPPIPIMSYFYSKIHKNLKTSAPTSNTEVLPEISQTSKVENKPDNQISQTSKTEVKPNQNSQTSKTEVKPESNTQLPTVQTNNSSLLPELSWDINSLTGKKPANYIELFLSLKTPTNLTQLFLGRNYSEEFLKNTTSPNNSSIVSKVDKSTGAVDLSQVNIPKLNNFDWLPTANELSKFINTSITNKKIDDIKHNPVLKMAPLAIYRHRGLLAYLNLGQQNASLILNTGNMIANATSDLGAGTAARLNSALKATGVISDAQAKYNNSILLSEALAIATGNLNDAIRVLTANENNAAIVANNNLNKIKHMLYLNKENANVTNLLNTISLGHLMGAQLRYLNAYNNYLMAQPEWNTYNDYTLRIRELLTANPSFDYNTVSDGWTLQDVDGYRKAYNAINKAGTLWKQRNNPTLPYAFAWMKNGGKMAEAEREKSRRAAAKLFFETVKHTNIMSLKAIKDSGHMSMYLLKRMMQGK